jgi:ubiquitin-conjugating enzyme E2 variant
MFSSFLVALKFVLKFFLTLVCADFFTGAIHWFEDAYGQADTPIVGKWIIVHNIEHHHHPRTFTKRNWWQSNWDLLCVALAIVAVAWWTGHLTWEVCMFCVLSANANEIHKWAHRTPRENGRLITFLHRTHLLQTTRHHARHHTDPKNSHYCTTTNFVNPFLDGLRLWEGLEWVLLKTLGLRRRIDTSVKPARGNVPSITR